MTHKNMKKITLLLWLIGTASLTYAQQTDTTRRTTVTRDTVKVYQPVSSQPNQPIRSQSNVQLSIRFAPGLAFNSAQIEGALPITNEGTAVRLSGGLSADIFVSETYAFSTGLWYTIKRSAFENVPFSRTSTGATPLGISEYNLQYLQVPVSLKLFTNEITTDTRVYFQLGGTFDVKLAEKAKRQGENAFYRRSVAQDTKVYSPIDVGILLGAGVEMRLSEHNSAYAGLTYNRGLMNALKGGLKDDAGTSYNDQMKSINSLLSLELGLKF
jgi:hypothetical protein